MTWSEYKTAHQLKGKIGLKKKEEHNKHLFVAWFNAYERPQKNLVESANKIINHLK